MPGEDYIESNTVIEQTDSGESHFIVRDLAVQLAAIRQEITEIREILLAGHESSEAILQQAQAALEAHEQSAQEYMHELIQPDYHPFAEMPAGTTVRDLPDGGRLFTLADGVFVRTSPDGNILAVTSDGEAIILEPARAGKVTLPDGRELTLVQEAVTATHEAAGIEGLPLDIEPTQVAAARFSVNLPENIRLDVSHKDRLATVINPAGTVVALGQLKLEGIGEDVSIRLVPGGARAFASSESNHQGIIEADGTIHLALSNGLDLVIRFPDQPDAGSGTSPDNESDSICEERE